MKIAKTMLATATVLALSLGVTAPALAGTGTGTGGTNSHHDGAHHGTGSGGTNSHHPGGHKGTGHGGDSPYEPSTVAEKLATGDVIRAAFRYDSEGRSVKSSFTFANVRATKITVRTFNCAGERIEKASRVTNPAAAGYWSYDYEVRTPKGAGFTVVKFSQPNKRPTAQYFSHSACE